MVRRVTPSQLKSQLRQIEQRHRQAVSKYNNAVRRTVNDYNREVRAHNSRVRANQHRLRNEIAKLNSRPVTVRRHVRYEASVQVLQSSFARVETASQRPSWRASDDLFDLTEGETANSVAVLNALSDSATVSHEVDDAELRASVIGDQLVSIDPDLHARWGGALYALSPQNPDAARHFCTSSREILTRILDTAAPDAEVLAANPTSETTRDGQVTRRARIEHCLRRRGNDEAELVDFVEDDLDDVIALFGDFNDGTHGSAGRYSLTQLGALKIRVEHAIQFLHRIVQ